MDSDLSQLPPHSPESEAAVIGCQLTDPSQCIPIVVERLDGSSDAFYDLRHQHIQKSIFTMFSTGKPVDIITLQQHLRDSGLLEQVGGVAYLNQIQDVPSAANLPVYLDEVMSKFTLRKYVQVCTDVVGKIYNGNVGDDFSDRVERDILAVRKIRGDGGLKPIKTLVHESLNDIEAMFNRKGTITGLSTGLPDLDRETDGFHAGEFILIAAFPSVGKTSLAMNIAEHVALDLYLPVGIFSAEMSAKSLVTRSICSRGNVNMRYVRDGKMTESDFPKISYSASKLSQSQIYIDDTSDLTTTQLRAKARRMVQQYGLKLIIADYAQLFSSPGAENRTNEVDQVSKTFKNMGKELGVPVILLSQLTEDAKGQVHLKGARALGEDADVYLMLKRPKNAADDPAAESEPIELWIRKQRNGARNKCINLTFLKTYTKFVQQSNIPEEVAENY